ncbi:MAG TPA: hypothetical protein VGO84_14580, partial [Burkholderiales bacterium]|nr:hypothetical protein [Burkholderiales bacterium]
LVGWFDAAADLLEEVKTGYTEGRVDTIQCWPHHFDMATVVSFDAAGAENARSLGIGLSPGDHYYPQPYLYVSAYPAPKAATLPPLALGHWHTEGFVGAIALGESILALDDRRRGALDFVRAAYDASRAKMGLIEEEQPQ